VSGGDPEFIATRDAPPAGPPPCGRCGSHPATMPGYDPARGKFCRACADRCHEATDAFHICQVCAAPGERYP
jgi:hypothetical protein